MQNSLGPLLELQSENFVNFLNSVVVVVVVMVVVVVVVVSFKYTNVVVKEYNVSPVKVVKLILQESLF